MIHTSNNSYTNQENHKPDSSTSPYCQNSRHFLFVRRTPGTTGVITIPACHVISVANKNYYQEKEIEITQAAYIKRVQKDVCVMIGDEGLVEDAPGSGHPIVMVNDTRNAIFGPVTIREAGSGKVVFSKTIQVDKNGKSVAGYLPKPGKTTLWLIEWEVNGQIHSNHYLAYEPVISLEHYLEWGEFLN